VRRGVKEEIERDVRQKIPDMPGQNKSEKARVAA
jgi:hypothetical protein